jgi:virulence-associated protein VagC
MAFAKLFKSGNGQFVRLPREFCFQGEEVEIFRRGAEVVLRRKAEAWSVLFGFSPIFQSTSTRSNGRAGNTRKNEKVRTHRSHQGDRCAVTPI